MKYLSTVILFACCTNLYIYANNEFDKYSTAYEFIQNDIDYIWRHINNKTPGDINFCVNSKPGRLMKFEFSIELIKYKYKITDEKSIIKYVDTSSEFNSKEIVKDSIYNDLVKLNSDTSSCTFVITFSKITENELSASVMLKRPSKITDEKEYLEFPGTEVAYYFCFNKESVIKKVFKKVIYH